MGQPYFVIRSIALSLVVFVTITLTQAPDSGLSPPTFDLKVVTLSETEWPKEPPQFADCEKVSAALIKEQEESECQRWFSRVARAILRHCVFASFATVAGVFVVGTSAVAIFSFATTPSRAAATWSVVASS